MNDDAIKNANIRDRDTITDLESLLEQLSGEFSAAKKELSESALVVFSSNIRAAQL